MFEWNKEAPLKALAGLGGGVGRGPVGGGAAGFEVWWRINRYLQWL